MFGRVFMFCCVALLNVVGAREKCCDLLCSVGRINFYLYFISYGDAAFLYEWNQSKSHILMNFLTL